MISLNVQQYDDLLRVAAAWGVPKSVAAYGIVVDTLARWRRQEPLWRGSKLGREVSLGLAGAVAMRLFPPWLEGLRSIVKGKVRAGGRCPVCQRPGLRPVELDPEPGEVSGEAFLPERWAEELEATGDVPETELPESDVDLEKAF